MQPWRSPRVLGAIVYITAFFAGFQTFTEKWTGMTAFSAPFKPRNPAAFKELDDFTRLQGEALLERVREHLITTTKIHRTPNTADIKIAHFLIRNPTGGPSISACDLYEEVVLNFEAEGMYVYGHNDERHPATGLPAAPERPRMIVEAPCREDLNDGDFFAPIKIPVELLSKNHAAPQELKEYLFNDDLAVTFKTPTNSWPKSWRLISIRLHDKTGIVEDIHVGRAHVKRYARDQQLKNLRFNWSL